MTHEPSPSARVPGAPPELGGSDRGALVEERIDAVRRWLASEGAAGALLESRRDAAWLTVGGELHVVQGSEAAVAPILITPARVVVIAQLNEAPRLAAEELDGLPLEIVEIPWYGTPEAELPRHVATDRLARGARLEAFLATRRPRLAPPEHERMRWLAAAARVALDGATAAAAPGRTESDVVAALVGPLASVAIRVPVVLASADARMRFRHPLPTTSPIEDRLMLVLVAERWGLNVAATRMVWLSAPDGEPHPSDAVAGRVLDAMLDASRPGSTLGDVLAAGQRAYGAEGMPDEWRNHHQGGTIGYAPRERIAVPDDPFRLETGMAVAWNPSVAGGKAEATALIGPDGAEVILS